MRLTASKLVLTIWCLSCLVIAQDANVTFADSESNTDYPQWSMGFGFGQGYNLHVTWRFPNPLKSLPAIRPAITVGYLALNKREPNYNWGWDYAPYDTNPEYAPPNQYKTTDLGKFAVLELQSHFIWQNFDWVIITGYGKYYPFWYSSQISTKLLTFGLRFKRDIYYGELLYFRPETPELYRGSQVSFGVSPQDPRRIMGMVATVLFIDIMFGALE